MAFGKMWIGGRGVGGLGSGGRGTSAVPITPGVLAAGLGTFTLTGDSMTPLVDYISAHDVGAFTLSGQDIAFTNSRILLASAASFIFTGVDATLVDQPAGLYTIAVNVGAFTLTGVDATLTDTPAPSTLISSIRQGTITIASGSASNTYTISPALVDATKAILIWNGINSASNTTGQDVRDAVRIAITGSGTVTATRGASPAFAVTVSFTIIEFVSGVNSIQAGTISVAAGSGATGTATISAVGANAFVIYQGCSWPTAVTSTLPLAGVTLTNSTTVTATVLASATVTQTVGYMVADLDSTLISSAQQKAVSISTANASDTDTLSSAVVLNNSSIMWGGVAAQTIGTFANLGYSTFQTNTTTVTKTRSGTPAIARTIYYTVVEWAAAVLNSAVQRSSTFALASQTSNTASITSLAKWSATATANKAFVNWNGFSAAAGNPNVTQPALALTSATVVTGTITSAGSATIPFEVVEFK